MTLEAQKKQARSDALKRRASLAVGLAGQAPGLLAERIVRLAASGKLVQPIAAYWPMGSEIDIRDALNRLHDRGLVLLLPVVVRKRAALEFRRWQPDQPLQDDQEGIPAPGEDAAPDTPVTVLVPLVAVDRDGYRLGYGGGYYDRTLAALRGAGPVTAIGVAFGGQLVDRLPRREWDQPLDALVTERGFHEFAASGTGTGE